MPSKPPTFRPKGHRTRQQANAEYDVRRGSARERGYDPRWDKEAAQQRLQHPWCLGCQAVGRKTPTAVIDHVIPHKGDRLLFWDPMNWQPACRFHHDVVKQRLEVLFSQGKVKATDLRLNSPAATELSLLLDPHGG